MEESSFPPTLQESVSGSGLRVKLLPQALVRRVAVCYDKHYAHTRYSPSWILWEAFSCIAAFSIFPCVFPPSYSLFHAETWIYQGYLGTVQLLWLFLTHTEQRKQHSAVSTQHSPGPSDHQKSFALCPWQCSSSLLFERGSAAISQA